MRLAKMAFFFSASVADGAIIGKLLHVNWLSGGGLVFGAVVVISSAWISKFIVEEHGS